MTRMTLSRMFAVVAAIVTFATSLGDARAQQVEYVEQRPPGYGPDRVRGTVYFGPHFAGRAQQSLGGTSFTQDLAPAPSLGARLEIPLGPFFVFGGFVDFVSLQASGAPSGTDRLALLGVGGWLKGRVIIDLDWSLLEFYVGVTIGLSVYVPTTDGTEAELGLATGVLGGAQAHLSDSIALFLEAGFRLDYFNIDDAKTTYLQAAVHAGVSFGF